MTLGKVSDSKILELKERGMSLRQIASALEMSHEAVRKRLKNLEGKGKVSTIETEPKLTASTIQNEKVSTAPNAHQSRASEESGVTVNLNTPSHTLTEDVNPLGTPSDKPWEATEGMKGVSPGAFSEIDDLFAAIKGFLENHSIEVYPMDVEPKAYQVKHNGQIIRLYVQKE